MTQALAGSRPAIAISDLVQLVDELTIASADSPASTVIRIPLISALRDEQGASIGSTGRGRGSSSRIPISAEALTVWGQVATIITDLHERSNGAKPRTGSLEQILAAWMRDVAAADADTRMLQYARGLPETGLSQDELHSFHTTLSWIRDRITQLLNPAAAGDIPGAACPTCRHTTVTIWRDDWEQMPALGFTRAEDGAIHRVTCRNPDCGATWTGWEGLQALRRQVELNRVFSHQSTERES